MRAPSARTRKIAGLSAAPLAVVLAGVMVWQGSTAAFTASTRNAGNAWTTGDVKLTDDDAGRAGFNVENMVPGQTGEKCIVVTSGANVPGQVRAYVENLSAPTGLSEHITLRVERGTGGSFADCAGFSPLPGALPAAKLSTLSTANKDFATGGSIWDTTGTVGENAVYRGTWTFDTSGMTQAEVDALKSQSVSVDLVWELQSSDAEG